MPLGLLVLKAGVSRSAEEVEREAMELVRERIGPVASFKTALVVAGLPKTRSGKIPRGTMRKIAGGEDYPLPPAIDDPRSSPKSRRRYRSPHPVRRGGRRPS